MAKKIKFNSSPGFARSHDAGAKSYILYQCLHDTYGALITPAVDKYWLIHMQIAEGHAKNLMELETRVLEVKPQPNHVRFVESLDIAYPIYAEGVNMVLHTVIAIEHFCDDVDKYFHKILPADFDEQRTDEKIRILAKDALGIDISQRPEYSGDFSKIYDMRHRIIHPTRTSEYPNVTMGNDWDTIPLNWFLCGRALKSFTRWRSLFSELVKKLDEILAPLPQKTYRFDNVQRGIGYHHSVKKAP